MRQTLLTLLFIFTPIIALAHTGRSDSAIVRFLETNYDVRFSDNNSMVLFKNGQEKFDDLFKAVNQARQSIHLEYFNFRNDSISHLLFGLLKAKAAQGVEVRAIFDGFGNTSNDRPIRKEHLEDLRAAGIEIVEFDCIRPPFVQNSYFRDHRKVVVIDGMLAYTGGMNVADYYINGKPEFGPWRDLHCRIEGDAVAELQKVFIDFWNQETGNNISGPQYYPGEKVASDYFSNLKVDTLSSRGAKKIGVVNRIPRKSASIIEDTFIEILRTAQHNVRLVNPYFTLSKRVSRAIEKAIKRGVKVEIMVSAKSDIPVTPNVVEYYSDRFRRMGATIHVFKDGFHHAKAMMVDDQYIFMGSANLNGRSLRIDYECNILVADSAATAALYDIYKQDIQQHSDTFTASDTVHRSPLRRFVNWAYHLIAAVL